MAEITVRDVLETHGALIARSGVCKLTGRSIRSIENAIRADKFPKPVHVGLGEKKSWRWRATDIVDWINSRPVAA